MVVVAEHQDLDADEGSPRRDRTAGGPPGSPAAGPPPRGPTRRAPGDRSWTAGRSISGGHDLERLAVDGVEGRPQRLVAPDDLGEAALEDSPVERPADAAGDGDVEGRLAGRQLVEEPEGLLGERGRDRSLVLDRPQRSDGRGRRRPACRSSIHRAISRDGRGLEQRAERQLDAERVAEPRRDLRGEQRVAAQVEEAVERADPVEPEHLGPDAREPLLDRVARRRRTRLRSVDRSRSGAGRALRSTLPLGVSGSASRATNADGTMYSGSRRPQAAALSPARRGPAPGAGTT